MEVQLLRTSSGEVVFLEAPAEFVDLLVKLLHAPLGAVLQSCADEVAPGTEHPLLCLSGAIPQLKDTLCIKKKNELLPDTLNIEKLLKLPMNKATKDPPTHCLCCLKMHGQVRKVTPNSPCGFCNYISPIESKKTAEPKCPKCAVPRDLTKGVFCPSCGYQSPSIVTLKLLQDWDHCAKCAASGNGKHEMVRGHPCAQCQEPNCRTCNNCTWCDACSVLDLGYAFEEATSKTRYLKDFGKYMVTNTLEVFEASPVKMLELISRFSDNFKGLKTSTVRVNPDQVKKLVLYSLLGSTTVLTESFKDCEVSNENELGSDAGTDGSFELAFDLGSVQADQKK
eukprot:TRINITY_DN34713_c0_g1_i1.p1 TRINITY_DN34713_c0_g1~~TRINITY_DN34713_c0_g1_i1.p1  ORF type:complete len:357 (+),score=49.37 TRINITY_DN34713_c0_g1_i1:59-1072(+)